MWCLPLQQYRRLATAPSPPPTPPPRALPTDPFLPEDLILYILDILLDLHDAQPVTPTTILTALALCKVSRLFLDAGRRLLYTRVSSTVQDFWKQHKGLVGMVETFEKLQHLRTLVQEVEVQCQLGDPRGGAVLCNIARLCPNLTTLALNSLPQNHRALDNPPFNIFGQNLTSIHLEIRRNDFAFFTHFGYFHGATLNRLNVPKLEELSLKNCTQLKDWTATTLKDLKRLKFDTCHQDVMHTLISASSTTLEELILVFPDSWGNVPESEWFSHQLSRLIRLEVMFGEGMRSNDGLLQMVERLALTSDRWPMLREVTVEMDTDKGGNEVDICSFLPDSVTMVEVRFIREGLGGRKDSAAKLGVNAEALAEVKK